MLLLETVHPSSTHKEMSIAIQSTTHLCIVSNLVLKILEENPSVPLQFQYFLEEHPIGGELFYKDSLFLVD